MNTEYDIIIIGAGVIGSALAREFSRYNIKTAVIEKNSDVGMETSGRNSGVVHAGFNCEEGTVKADLCVRGCQIFGEYCDELGVPFERTGKLVAAFDERDYQILEELKDTGEKNGVQDLEIISQKEIKKMEPNIEGKYALYSPWTGVTDPHLLTIALAENAVINGVDFFLEREVTDIEKNRTFKIRTDKESFTARYILNSAGLYADKIAKMVGIDKYNIYPCRGEYFVLDKNLQGMIERPVYPAPRVESGGLGVHLTTTVDGNILIGPSAEYINERTNYATTSSVMEKLYSEAKELLPLIERKDIIRSYSGVRPKLVPEETGGFADFMIEEDDEVEHFINLMGIESPGLTAAPIIAEMVVDILKDKEELVKKDRFRSGYERIKFSELSDEDKDELIKKDSDYGKIVCRCEEITLKEIKDALNNPLGVKTITGIKYRTRAGMGRCQGGFCLPKIIEQLREDYPAEEIEYSGEKSLLFAGQVK